MAQRRRWCPAASCRARCGRAALHLQKRETFGNTRLQRAARCKPGCLVAADNIKVACYSIINETERTLEAAAASCRARGGRAACKAARSCMPVSACNLRNRQRSGPKKTNRFSVGVERGVECALRLHLRRVLYDARCFRGCGGRSPGRSCGKRRRELRLLRRVPVCHQ